MAETFSFTAADRLTVLEALARGPRPATLRVVVHGDARALGPELGLRVFEGRVLAATPSSLSIERVLLRIAFAQSGRIERSAEPEPAELGAAVPLALALAEAERQARALDALLAPIGGPRATVLTRSEGIMRAALSLGTAALGLANQLNESPRLVGELLTRSSDDLATARLIEQLRDLGVLEVLPDAGAAPEASTAEQGLARARGPSMRGRTRASQPPRPRASVPPRAGAPPRASVSPQASVSPRASASPQASAPPPAPPAPPPPSPPPLAGRHDAPDDAELRAAGLDRGSPLGWAAVVAAILFFAALAWRLSAPPPPVPVAIADPPPSPVAPPAVPPPPPPAPPVVTSTPSAPPPPPAPAAGPRYSFSNPPPLAGPEADRRLREAEQLIEAGRFDEAEAILAPLRSSRPRDPLVWLLTGTLLLELGRYEEARTAIDRAIAIDPRSYRGHILRGSNLQFQGDLRGAVRSYRAALSIAPGHAMSSELREVADRLEASAP